MRDTQLHEHSRRTQIHHNFNFKLDGSHSLSPCTHTHTQTQQMMQATSRASEGSQVQDKPGHYEIYTKTFSFCNYKSVYLFNLSIYSRFVVAGAFDAAAAGVAAKHFDPTLLQYFRKNTA